MTLRLAIDTATGVTSVAVAAGAKVLAHRTVRGRGGAGVLIPTVAAVLGEVTRDIADVDEVLLADGPGGFTGLRVGFASVQAFVTARARTVYLIPSLIALAAASARDGETVVATYDALRGDVFATVVRPTGATLDIIVPPSLMSGGSLRDLPRPDRVIGDKSLSCVNGAWAPAPVASERDACATNLIRVLDRYGVGRVVDDMFAVTPVYGRLAEAQVRWEQEHGRPLSPPRRHD